MQYLGWKRNISLCFFAIALSVGASAAADPWTNRPNVLAAGKKLGSEIHALDKALHEAKAHSHVIALAHHMEQTTLRFVTSVESGSTYAAASLLFHQIHEDLHELDHELEYHHHSLLHNPKVATEWKHTNTVYSALDREMYRHDNTRWTSERLDALEKSLESIPFEHER